MKTVSEDVKSYIRKLRRKIKHGDREKVKEWLLANQSITSQFPKRLQAKIADFLKAAPGNGAALDNLDDTIESVAGEEGIADTKPTGEGEANG